MTLRAILFDVGGPIDTEVRAEAMIDEALRALLAEHGLAIDQATFAAANDWAVSVFAPNTYRAILWRLCMTNDRAALAPRLHGFTAYPARPFELRPGIASLLERLHARGLKLGLAANQPAAILERLDAHGIGRFFAHREVAGHHGYHKPDVRLFLRACEDLGVAPGECVMVGDRIDNDIVPARVLGMRTLLFRTGRHIAQQPRAFDEVPHAEVWDVAGLEAVLEGWLAGE